MADILTHLRELSFCYGFENDDISDPLTFLNFCHNKILNTSHLKISQISSDKDFFSEKELDTINNGINFSRFVKNKNIIEKPFKYEWKGFLNSKDSSIDVKINDKLFSLKEDSDILHNMGFSSFLNAITNSSFDRGLHIFLTFSKDEFLKWFDFTKNLVFNELKSKDFQIKDSKNRNIFLGVCQNDLILSFDGKQEILKDFLNKSYFDFDKLDKELKEKVFAKYLNKVISKNKDYISLKKECMIVAGNNLIKFVIEKQKENNSFLTSFFRISSDEYFFLKWKKEIELYLVPSLYKETIKLEKIELSVPKSQLNILFHLSSYSSSKKIILRFELRYSHGQFNGVPEAKLYLKEGSLDFCYKRI